MVVKTCLFFKDDQVWNKYNKIWDVIKNKINIKFQSEPLYEYKYVKSKVREFNGVIKTIGCQKKIDIILALLA